MEDVKIQVPKDLYFTNKYNSLERFISYYHQVSFAVQTEPHSILEIGIGNKIVTHYLKNANYKVTSCDYDKNLEPDFVADVRKLPFGDNEFDTVLAYEILEHIPFSDFEKALEELKRASKKYVVISIPYNCAYLSWFLSLKVFLKNRKIDKKLPLVLKLPYFFKKINIKENGQHYWEMGAKGYSKSKIKKILKKYFSIVNSNQGTLDYNHHFFILKK